MVRLSPLMDTSNVFYQKSVYVSPVNASVSSVYAKQSNQVTLEQLIHILSIWFMTFQHTLIDAKHQCISTKGLQAKRFKRDNAQFWYKKLCHRHITFYVDYLKVWTKYVRGFIGIFFKYSNKMGLNKFSHVQMKLKNRQVTPLRVV